MGAVLAAAAVLLAAGCAEVPTQTLVHLDAEPQSRMRARQLQVQIRSQEGEIRLDRTVPLGEGSGRTTLPTRIPVMPLGGDADRTFLVETALLDREERPFNRIRRRFGFQQNRRIERRVVFTDACIEVTCGEDAHCDGGSCAPVPPAP